MGRHEDEVREQMERDADIMRGLGQSYGLGVEDMRHYGERLNWAAVADAEPVDEREFYDQLAAELEEEGEQP